MKKPTEEHIKEIAEYLDAGMTCYYNKENGKIVSIPDFDDFFDSEENPWEEELRKIEENRKNYMVFEKMPSRDAFNVMADFAESIDDTKLQDRLFRALNESKPFRNFKWEVDNSGAYRQLWFDFKHKQYIKWVKDQVEYMQSM